MDAAFPAALSHVCKSAGRELAGFTAMAMARKHLPEWAAKRARGNRIIGLVLFGLVLLYVLLFVTKYVVR